MIPSCFKRVKTAFYVGFTPLDLSQPDTIPGMSNRAKAILTCRAWPSRHTIARNISSDATKPIRLDLVLYYNFSHFGFEEIRWQ